MNWLRRIALAFGGTLAKWMRESPGSSFPLKVDPQEFTRLLCSGRKHDLKTLAKLLSGRQQRR